MADLHNQVKHGIDAAADKAKQATDKVAGAVQGAHGQAGQVGQQARTAVNDASRQAGQAAGQAQDKAEGVLDQAREGVKSALDAAGRYVNVGDIQGKAGEWADEATHAARQAGDRVQHWAEDAYQGVGNLNVGDFGQEVTTLIRKHPVPALLIGFGVGLLLGRAAKA